MRLRKILAILAISGAIGGGAVATVMTAAPAVAASHAQSFYHG